MYFFQNTCSQLFAWTIPADLSKLRASIVSVSRLFLICPVSRPLALAWAAFTKYYRPGSSNNGHLFLTVLGAGKSRIKVLADMQSSEGSAWFVGCHLLCVLTWQEERELWSLPLLLRTLVATSCSHLNLESMLVAQLCLTLCDPMDCSPPGFSVHRILQARILEWVVISFSRGIFPIQEQNPSLLHSREILYLRFI